VNKFFFVAAVAVVGLVWTGVCGAQDKVREPKSIVRHVWVCSERPLDQGTYGSTVQVCQWVAVQVGQ
jgi:hypothetical protein